jgi:hypothetical protein
MKVKHALNINKNNYDKMENIEMKYSLKILIIIIFIKLCLL